MVGSTDSRSLAAPLLYGLGVLLLHTLAVQACTCPTMVTPNPNTFPITPGIPFGDVFASLVDQCMAPETDTCGAPLTCQCVEADFLVPDSNFALNPTTNTWFFQVDVDVVCATDVVPTCLDVACTGDGDCQADEICCTETDVCVLTSELPAACGDPHMIGFHGQKFDFTGTDGLWYALLSDLPSTHMNMRVTSPIPSLPEITYITGLSILTTDANGFPHSIVIAVKDPHTLSSACPEGVLPCLADGSLNVMLDGQEALAGPGSFTLGPDVTVTAANLPGQCRSFGFETYWEKKKLEYAAQAGRRLGDVMDMSDWILADPTATNMRECTDYVAQALVQEGGVFAHQSEHTSFQISTPAITIRLSHGRLHQLSMRDPTDSFDLPDHLTWQMNMAIDRASVSSTSTGVLGETFTLTTDSTGTPIMHGMEAIRGSESDYLVSGPLDTEFAMGTNGGN